MIRLTHCLASILVASPLLAQWSYPPTKQVDAVDTYFGKTYQDPYRWLENLKAPDTEAWFKAQANLTDAALDRIPGRDALAEEWMRMDRQTPARYGGITVEYGRIFYKKTLGGENVGKLYLREGWKGKERLIFDPSTYKAGVVTTLNSMSPSWDGKHVALGLTSSGSEWSEIRILDVAKGTLLPDSIYPSYGAMGWLPDGRGFFYDAGKTTDLKSLDLQLNRKTRIHRLGQPVASDPDIFSNESFPDLGITPKEIPGAFINEAIPGYVLGWLGTVQNESRIYIAPASGLAGKLDWKVLCAPSDKIVRGMAIDGDYVYGVTHEGAARYKLVRTRLSHPDWAKAETVLPEAADSIQSITKSRHYLFVVYSNGVTGRIVQYDLKTGKAKDLKLPGSGTVDISCPDWKSDHCLVYISSWIAPMTIYDFDPAKGSYSKSPLSSDTTYAGFENLITEEVEVPSHDGTMVPLSIIRRKDLPMDGSSSCILEGYGAYGISYTPWFNPMHSLALRGVVIAYAHPRGGSEKGEAWYKAGYKTTKPNTWKDFIACGEYLVKRGYTKPEHLAGTGTSAGGILITRAITERPDLFRAAVCNVGCANAMRMEFSPNGPVNTPEFGTVKDEAECKALAEMDGVGHVQPGVAYPAVLGVGGWNDPRVPAWQPGKFVAAMQQATASNRPVLMKVNYDNGHFTEEKKVTFKNFAGQFAFLLWQTGHPDFQPTPSSPTPAAK